MIQVAGVKTRESDKSRVLAVTVLRHVVSALLFVFGVWWNFVMARRCSFSMRFHHLFEDVPFSVAL